MGIEYVPKARSPNGLTVNCNIWEIGELSILSFAMISCVVLGILSCAEL